MGPRVASRWPPDSHCLSPEHGSFPYLSEASPAGQPGRVQCPSATAASPLCPATGSDPSPHPSHLRRASVGRHCRETEFLWLPSISRCILPLAVQLCTSCARDDLTCSC